VEGLLGVEGEGGEEDEGAGQVSILCGEGLVCEKAWVVCFGVGGDGG
jgi:hypothetical protein